MTQEQHHPDAPRNSSSHLDDAALLAVPALPAHLNSGLAEDTYSQRAADSHSQFSSSISDTELLDLTLALKKAFASDLIVSSAAQSHIHQGRAHTSWLLSRWWRLQKADPLARFRITGLGQQLRSQNDGRERGAAEHNAEHNFAQTGLTKQHSTSKSRPTDSAPISNLRVPSLGQDRYAVDRVAAAIGHLTSSKTRILPQPWRAEIRQAVQGAADDLIGRTGEALSNVQLRKRTPLWWQLVNLVQWISAFCLLCGVVWLLLKNFGEAIGLILPQPPVLGVFSLPLILVLGGLSFGWLASFLSEPLLRFAAKSIARKVDRQLSAQIKQLSRKCVVSHLEGELRRYQEYLALVEQLKSAR